MAIIYNCNIMKDDDDDDDDSCFYIAFKHHLPEGKRDGVQKRIHHETGISQSMLSQIYSGTRNAGLKNQIKIAKAFGFSYDEFVDLGRSLLETGFPPPKKIAGNQPLSQTHNLVVQVNSKADKDRLNGISEYYRGIPLYESGKLSVGVKGLIFDPNEEPASTLIVYKSELHGHVKHNLRALRVGGDSMKPTVVEGSIIVVDLDDKEYADRKIFVVRTADMIAAVKRVGKWEQGFYLVSDNPDFIPEPTGLDWNELCVGRVIWQWKDMRDA